MADELLDMINQATVKESTVEKPEETPETEKKYHFSSGTNDDFKKLIDEMKIPKEEYEIEEEEDDEEEFEPTTEVSASVKKKISGGTAKFITKNIDRLVEFGLTLIDDDDDNEYRLQPDEEKELIECWELMFPDPSKGIPPWAMVLVTSTLIYGPKVKDALRNRKLAARLEEEQRQNHELRNKLDELSKEKNNQQQQ